MSLKINHITNTLQVDDTATNANILLVPKGTGFIDLSSITVASNATNTGALVVGGGIGVGGSITVGGSLTVVGGISASITGVSTTATNIAGGLAGQLTIQSAPGVTTFVPGGTDGNLLQYLGTTATFTSTTTLQVGYATNATNLSGGSVNATTGVFSGVTTVTNSAAVSNTTTGALRVTGGAGIGGGLYVGGIVTATVLRTLASEIALGSSSGVGQGSFAVAIGNSAGNSTQGAQTVAIGNSSGNSNQAANATAVGYSAGRSDQGTGAVAIGSQAGYSFQGTTAIAIGQQAGYGNQGTGSIAIGFQAGYGNQIVQGAYSIALGYNAGYYSTPAGSIIISAGSTNYVGTATNAGFYVAPIRTDATTAGTTHGVFYNPVTKELTTSTTGIIAGSAGTATNIAAGSAGQIPMQNSTGSTTFIESGAAGTILQAGSNNTATWVSTSTVRVGYANTANTASTSTNATNVTGGYVNATTGVFSGITTVTNTFVINGQGGLTGQATISNSGPSPTSIRQTFGTDGTGWQYRIAKNQTGTITDLFAILDSGAIGVGTQTNFGTAGQVLQSNGTGAAPTWVTSAGLSAGNSTTATNIAGGSAGQIPIQSAAGSTTFITSGANGTLLQAGSGNTASFVSTGTIRVAYADTANNATTATNAGTASLANNIAGGAAGQMPIQTSAGVTTFIPAGTSGQVLTYGTNTATWTTAVGNATNATNLSGGAQYQIPYQSGVGATAFSANLEFDGNTLFVNVGSATQLNTGYTNRLNVSGGIVAGNAASTNGSIILQGLYGANGAITNFGTEYSTGGPVIGYGVYPSGVSSGAFLSSGPAALSRGAYTISGNSHNWYIGGSQTTAIGNPVTMTLAMTLTATGALAFNGASNYGSSGYVLQSNGNSAPTWVALSGVSSGSASVANNIAGGSVNQIPYQSGAGSTSFSANLTWDGTNLKVNTSNVLTVASAASTGLTAYDISNFINGKPLSGEVILRALMVRSCSFAGNFAGSYAVAGTAPSAAAGVSMIIYKQGVAVGTLTFAQSSTSGVFATTGGTAVSFIAGNQLVIQVDNSVNGQDPSFADMALTLFGTVAV